MRKLVRFILLIAVLVAIFLLVSPIYYGKRTEFFVKKMVRSMNQQYNKVGVNATVQSYQRSWYSSKVVVNVSINNPKFNAAYKKFFDPAFTAKKPFAYQEVIEVSHGPVVYRHVRSLFSAAYLKGHITLPKVVRERLHLTKPFARYAGSIGYRGTFSGQFKMAPVRFASKYLSFETHGVVYRGKIDAALNHFSGKSLAQPMSLHVQYKGLDEKIHLTGVGHTHFNLSRAPVGLWVGSIHAKLPHESLVIKAPGSKNAMTSTYSGLSERLEATLLHNQYTLGFDARVKHFEGYGVQSVKNIRFDWRANNMNATVFKQFQDLFMQSIVQYGDKGTDAVGKKLAEIGPKLLTKQSSFEIRHLTFTLPKGTVALNAKTATPGYKSGMPVFEMLGLLHASLHVSADRSLVDYYLQLARKIYQAKLAERFPVMAPGPAIPKSNTGKKPLSVSSPVKRRPKLASKIKFLIRADKLFKYALKKGYISLKDGRYVTTLVKTPSGLTANGKRIK